MGETTGDKAGTRAVMRALRGRAVVRDDADEVIDDLAALLLSTARQRVLEAGVFHLALSGGRTPEALYRRLMVDPRYRPLPWGLTHLWQVDERCVGADDERRNYKTIREMLVEHSDIPPDQAHPMPVLEQGGDERYERDLRAALAGERCGGRLDFVLLGMGADGHTASLFPNSPALAERRRWVVFNDGPTVAAPRPRMTLTYPAINAGRKIVVLVTGEAKHAALQRVALAARSEPSQPGAPIAGVGPSHADGELRWYLDRAAAAGPAG